MIDISTLNETELITLNSRVVDRIKSLRRFKSQETALSLKIGSKVTFNGKTGVITKINRVKAKVNVNGATWNVPMNMLTLV